MANNPLILAIDQGTTSSRAIVFDTQFNVLSMAQEEITQSYPQSGWVEQNPDDLFNSVVNTSRRALAEAERHGGKVCAIGITNQRETSLLWDKSSGQPIYKAIVWQDRRTSDYCESISDGYNKRLVQQKTGLLIDPYFSSSKIRWMLNHIDGARLKAEQGKLQFGTVDTYLLARLTGFKAHSTDATNASRTSLYNIVEHQWDDDLLKLFDIPQALLPEVKNTCDHFGVTDKSIFGRAIPILSLVGDQQAAGFGQTCYTEGDIKSTYGTGCFILVNTGERLIESKNKLLGTIAYQIEGKCTYALEGSIFTAGSAIKWLRDSLAIIKDANETEALAAQLSDNGGVYLVPAFTGLGAPHWRSDARAQISGLSFGATRAHIARATLESVVYQTKDLIEVIKKEGVQVNNLRVDGGMVANNWFLQFLADMLDTQVERPRILETTALGAASLAGLQAGLYGSTNDICQYLGQGAEFNARIDPQVRAKLYSEWTDAVTKLVPSFHSTLNENVQK